MTAESSRLIAIVGRGDPAALTMWIGDGEKRGIQIVSTKNGMDGFEIIEIAMLRKMEADLADALHEGAILRGRIRARDWKRTKYAKAKTDMVKVEEAHP